MSDNFLRFLELFRIHIFRRQYFVATPGCRHYSDAPLPYQCIYITYILYYSVVHYKITIRYNSIPWKRSKRRFV